MKIEDKIDLLGDAFRGLWKSREVVDGKINDDTWCVTFVFKGHYVETPLLNCPHAVLDYAIITLKEDKG